MSSPLAKEAPLPRLTTLRQDLFALVVVFLVALPLCMGVAIASGVPVAAGLFTGIVGGLVVGALAGSPLQVSGPAAGLAVIVLDIVQRFGVERLGIVVLIAGLLQVLAGTLRIGIWFRAVSPAVIKGMLAGIGVIIFSSQFHVMLDDKPSGNVLRDLISIPKGIAKAFTLNDYVSSDKRKFRSKHLELMTALRREQAEIAEQVRKLLPNPASEPEALAKELEVQIESKPEGWDELVEHQAKIAEKVTAINAVVRDFEADHD